MSAITIPKGSITLAGLLFTPANTSSKHPGIIVVHQGGGSKEQAPSFYAQKLVEHGYVVLAYDAAHQNASGGLPRHLEHPPTRVADVSAVADYLQTLACVDAGRIFLLGICAGGGYATAAATADHRFSAVAVVNAYNLGDAMRRGLAGADDLALQIGTLDHIAGMATADARSGEPTIIPRFLPELSPSAGKEEKAVWEYYINGRAPRSDNKLLVSKSTMAFATWDAWAFADVYLTQPFLVVYGARAPTKWNSERLLEVMRGKGNVRTLVHEEAGHVDLYDVDRFVDPTVREIHKLFGSV